ncbi:nucleotide exchange factor GrpE [Caulobacter sp. 17J80-11]|uniref:nucleotide exchange factor GrpE n=1 Tax=Caulobacter sp. 17J80-11 TaxID=2763502 RepID=UPI00165354A5|nr:nucleotide exchange factor GrpE [Caulobacter sp. 17J80-11]MBC6982836.1 nucleotide exchange factor GrpE [Caulobacter sp. 17J80-11]
MTEIIKRDDPADANPETETLLEAAEEVIARLEAEVAEWKDHAMRSAAETENIRRRSEREMNDARAYAITRFAKDLLGVSDNLGRALQHAPRDHADPVVNNLVLGVDMTEKELLGAFERNGLKRVDPGKGDKFDPHMHQAMMEQASDEVPAGAVIQVLQPGYELFGRIVRPAMVVVAAKSGGKPAGAPYAGADAAAGGSIDTKA